MMRDSPIIVGALGILQFILIALKILYIINWSWWFVLAPYFIGNALLTFTLVKEIIKDSTK